MLGLVAGSAKLDGELRPARTLNRRKLLTDDFKEIEHVGLGVVHLRQDAGKVQDLDPLFLEFLLHKVPVSSRRRVVRPILIARKSPPHQLGPHSRAFLEKLNGAADARLSQQDDSEDIQVGQKLLDQVRILQEFLHCILLVLRHLPVLVLSWVFRHLPGHSSHSRLRLGQLLQAGLVTC